MSYDQYADKVAQRVRQCAKCGGAMRCTGVEVLTTRVGVGRGSGGREYTLTCDNCGARLVELSGFRFAMVVAGALVGAFGGALLLWVPAYLAMGWIRHGLDPQDDPVFIVIIFVLCLGVGVPLSLLRLWALKRAVFSALELRRNPVIAQHDTRA